MDRITDPDRPVFTGRVLRRLLLVLGLLGGMLGTGALVAGAIVTDEVRLDTPIVLDGEVWDVEQVGNFVVVAGNFTQIQTERNGPTITQPGLFAYEIDSGNLHEGFRPIIGLNNPAKAVEIRDLEVAADGRSIYFGGRFTTVDDRTDGKVRTRNRIAKIDVRSGRLDRNFARGGVDAKVLSMTLTGGDLYVAGNFRNIFDTDVGRPPLEHAQYGLARFDATTGAFDSSFRFETQWPIGQFVGAVRNGGVNRLDATPDGRYLVMTHRGRDVADLTNNVIHRRPGVAIFDLTPAVPAITDFYALWPDPNDPNQDMFHETSCLRNRGIWIRDMEISPDGTYFVITNSGHDTGYACDTAIRYPITTVASRPDWVSRIFDTTFSVGIADDAIYVGGHFRYMVHPNAPTSYPGKNAANGGYPAYTADPNVDASFRNDLVNPGYVYRAYQIGAIDPATGRGIPEWNPGTDAYKGILAITVVDRGLLVGHDRGRIAGFNVGRQGFFDDTPDVGNPNCRVEIGDDRDPVITWTDIGNVDEWRIARNGEFQTGLTGSSWTDTNAPIETDLTYELRFNRNGLSQTDDCGTVRVDLIPISCIVETRSDSSLDVDWNTTDSDRHTIRRDDAFVASIDDRTRFEDTGLSPGTTYTYEVIAIIDGQETQSATCSGTTAERAITCSVAVNGEAVSISFNGDDFRRVTVRRDGNWTATLSDGETVFSETVAPGTYRYEATGVVNGFRSTADCGIADVAARAVACSVAVVGDEVTVSFNGTDFSRSTIRRDGVWQNTLDAGETTFAQTVPAGTYAYQVTGVFNGFEDTAECGTATVAAPVLVCTTEVQGDDVLVGWNDLGAAGYQARRDGGWAATVDAGETSWSDVGGAAGNHTYQVRYRLDGVTTTVDCA
jgi:hypothetical protein